ncbi:hypothetical protein [Agromyces badenianii]|uniref:hypothetical protein n=1 Tax=Agromyces badenianii TaxID=2080742 RepID=UPI0010593A95|nr:hypothetical protein [Agromyces badenianii]
MGFDARVSSAMLSLGYDVFPFEAFDPSGRVKIPEMVQLPTHVRDGIGRVAVAPAWAEIYRTLSVLDDPQWRCFMVGVGYQSGTLNVAIFKPSNSVGGPDQAHEWSRSYQSTVATTLKSFSGTRHVVDPAWFEVLDDAIDKVKQYREDRKNPATDPASGTATGDAGIDPPKGELGTDALGTFDVVLMGLSFMSKFLRTLKVSTEIRTTVYWYAVSGTDMNLDFARRWRPIHTDYRLDGTIRAVHGLWDPAPAPGSPRFWKGSEVDWKAWLWKMPHESWQWCMAFYPTLNCGGPQLLAGDEVLEFRAVDRADELSRLPVIDPLPPAGESALSVAGLEVWNEDELDENELDDDGAWIAEGELASLDLDGTHPTCPSPTKWKLVGTSPFKGTMRPVSSAVTARIGPIRYTFRVERALTFSATVTGGVKVAIPTIELETGLSLTTSVTITSRESVTYDIPKGATVALFGGCGYYVRIFRRTVYGSAMCNPVVQETKIASPYMKYLEPRRV